MICGVETGFCSHAWICSLYLDCGLVFAANPALNCMLSLFRTYDTVAADFHDLKLPYWQKNHTATPLPSPAPQSGLNFAAERDIN